MLVDPGKQGQNRAGTDSKDRPGDRGNAVSNDLSRAGTEVLDHARLADEDRDCPGDEERRNQAEEDMLPRVLLQHQKRLHPRATNDRIGERDQVRAEKYGKDPTEDLHFLRYLHAISSSLLTQDLLRRFKQLQDMWGGQTMQHAYPIASRRD